MDKIIITVVGKDTVGIIAKVCTYLAETGVNILDISQTIVQDYFNMMTISPVRRSPLRSCPAGWKRSDRRSVSGSNAREKRSLPGCTGYSAQHCV